jgi:hypothetical protein
LSDKTRNNTDNRSVKFSCVMDQQPKFAHQALCWAATLLTFGGQKPDSLIIHAIDGCHADVRRIFSSWGVTTRAVTRFTAESHNANKLSQLESEALHTAEYVVLCDCDLVFCANISDWITGSSIRARTPSYAGLTPKQWSQLFQTANLDMPHSTVRAVLEGRPTLPTYCNGALYIIPQPILQQLRPLWPKWARWLFRRPELVKRLPTSIQQVAMDQVALTLSCAELGLSIDHLPVEVNFPVRGTPRGGVSRGLLYRAPRSYHPLVLHHHARNPSGLLLMTATPYLNRQIARVNRLLSSINRTNGASIQALIRTARGYVS